MSSRLIKFKKEEDHQGPVQVEESSIINWVQISGREFGYIYIYIYIYMSKDVIKDDLIDQDLYFLDFILRK